MGSSLAIAVTTAATWSGLATWLAGAGIPAWCDHEIATGERWEQVIQEQILGCDAMLVVMTPGADKSLWVKREIIFAENNGKGVLPLLLAGQPFFRLAEVHYENVTGKRMPSAAFAASVRRLIDQTYRERTAEITAANVGALVMVPAEHERLLRQFDLVERWARAHLAEALEAVKTLPHGRMRDVLFDLLVGGLRRTGKNAMGLPTAKEPVASQWCIDLASLLRRYVERKGRLSVETFVKTLRGSVLKSGADFYAARELWSRLGYEPRDDDYVIRCILDEIARTDRVSAEARDALVGMRQPIQQLVDVARERPGVAPGIPPMSPGTTVELLLVSVGADRYTHEGDRKVGYLARVVTEKSLPDHQGANGPEDWVTRFLGGVVAPRLAKPTRRAVADGAWTGLQAHQPGLAPGPELQLSLKEFGLIVPAGVKAEKAPGRHDTVDQSHDSDNLADPGCLPKVPHAGVAGHIGDAALTAHQLRLRRTGPSRFLAS